ncbi:hypothetical protein PJL18_04239 [Paenarthrobacter nicotinovorans]|nr:hypothetical protein [Paenarthrobacter nicotinovorans]
MLRLGFAMEGPLVQEHFVAGPIGVAGEGIGVDTGVGPGGLHLTVPFLAQRQGYGSPVGGQAAVGLLDVTVDVVLPRYGVVLQ